jgi:hypothetical protein
MSATAAIRISGIRATGIRATGIWIWITGVRLTGISIVRIAVAGIPARRGLPPPRQEPAYREHGQHHQPEHHPDCGTGLPYPH